MARYFALVNQPTNQPTSQPNNQLNQIYQSQPQKCLCPGFSLFMLVLISMRWEVYFCPLPFLIVFVFFLIPTYAPFFLLFLLLLTTFQWRNRTRVIHFQNSPQLLVLQHQHPRQSRVRSRARVACQVLDPSVVCVLDMSEFMNVTSVHRVQKRGNSICHVRFAVLNRRDCLNCKLKK